MNIKRNVTRLVALLLCFMLISSGLGACATTRDSQSIHIALVCRDGMQYDAARFQKGMEMAILEYAGDYDIHITLYDESTNFEEALEVDTRLAQDPEITAVVTLQDYDEIDVAARVMDENNTAYFAVEGYLDSTVDKDYETFFPFCLDASHLGYAMGQYTVDQNYDRVAVIHSGTSFELTQANSYEAALLLGGGQTVNSLSEPSTTDELFALMDSLETLDTNTVYLPYYRSYWAVDIIRAIYETKPDCNILASFTLGSSQTVEALKYAEGTVLPAFYPVVRSSEYRSWEQRYIDLYKETPENQAVQGYDLVNLIVDNYDGSNTNLAQNIRNNSAEVTGVAGSITYDLVNDLPDAVEEPYSYEYLIIRDGKFIPVE